ncbi:MAG: peptidoglycan DD-metalloendopeptidase family protein [Pseudoxanthomonas suwonensis]|nr:peptidoglycan DD-metalloendopeptidase family protein [Pseudoxanthomonas suwonensis]
MSNGRWRIVVAVALALALTACASSRVVSRAGDARATGQAPVRVSQPKHGATYVVQRGDTIYRIATGNGITPLDLALWNGIRAPYTIYPGQRLNLYPGGPSRPSASTTRPASRPGSSPRPAPARPSTPASAPVRAPFSWRWPADGGVIERFVNGDPTRQGIGIGGNAGAPVRAAADGTVVYSGSGLVGYGELIIVKHDDNWLSAYGHNRARLVNEGALVKAGQQIGELGRSGTSRDKLHFEIRYNGRPVDPSLYLPPR